ncbi:DegQ family serine endoprotease [Pseudoduganella plicata]|uniref:Probable periplasmic serine endoprotease DegP-like n=1 Tax=Pseudoduganella plicata TaxID=321984 RepID=A0A4P7BCH4_9BURK|nr:DegQ family serine endoprotease [Pseudoduganella plicata]QBQ36341.1 DegQ family serine endoprotease [Pseudoduganella plicata]GGY75969.1 serine protease [Pseudoduganella plicata]
MSKTTVVSMTMKRLVATLCAVGVLGAGAAIAVQRNNAAEAAPAPALAAAAPAAAAPTNAAAGAPAPTPAPMIALPDFSVIASRNGPAVVNISTTGRVRAAYDGRGEPFADDPFFEFFRRFQGPQRGGGNEAPSHGVGSGFIISADGIILTNAHVVRDASEVSVKLTDRREFRAKVLGSDPKTDVAVLKIDAKNLPVVPLGRSTDLKVGEWVLAIGSPFGLESTVTAGVVSAKGRSLPDDSNVPFIQTDVAVNPGNSGGPLFNTKGEVVGINSQIYSQTGGYQGLSFAIPIDLATRIKDQIVATGKVVHARLGVTVQEVNQSFADSFGLPTPEGALVANIQPGSPGEQAGLKPGDVIRSVNGQKIVASGDLPAMVALAKPGDKLTMDVWRQGKAVTLTGKLGNANDRVLASAEQRAPADKLRLGLALRPLDQLERRQMGLPAGLVIEDAGGAAASAGVMPGDVLLSVNGRTVTSVEQVRDVVSRSDRSVALLIQRGEERIFIPVRLG